MSSLSFLSLFFFILWDLWPNLLVVFAQTHGLGWTKQAFTRGFHTNTQYHDPAAKTAMSGRKRERRTLSLTLSSLLLGHDIVSKMETLPISFLFCGMGLGERERLSLSLWYIPVGGFLCGWEILSLSHSVFDSTCVKSSKTSGCTSSTILNPIPTHLPSPNP